MISWVPLKPGFWYFTNRLRSIVRWPDLLLSEFCELFTKLFPFDSAIIAIEKPCQHDILRTAWARILIFGIWLRINVSMTWLTFEWIPWNICGVMSLSCLLLLFICFKTSEPQELGAWNFICDYIFIYKEYLLTYAAGTLLDHTAPLPPPPPPAIF